MGSASVWAGTAVPEFPRLDRDVRVDVCIVGAGIAGLSAAYELIRGGRSVVVLDDGAIGSGETGRTTAHLANAIDDGYLELERLHGEKGAAIAAESHTAAIDRIESIVADEKIDCSFERVDGYLFPGPGDDVRLLEREADSARRAGLASVELLKRAPQPFLGIGPCLRFPRQGQFHPLRYLSGLAGAIQRRGGRIYCGTHVSDVKDGTPATVETSDGPAVTAADVIVATNTPINDRFTIHTKQAPYRTYAIAARVPAGSVAHALFWDTCNPYHYVRVEPSSDEAGELLIVGGEDHKTGQPESGTDRHELLEQWARARFPMLGSIEYRWSGQVLEPVDYVAFIGRNPGDRHIFVHTGDSGMGMTHGVLGGMLNSDLILGRENPWAALYDPARRTLGAAREFLRENVNVAAQYGDWLTSGDVSDPAAIAPGTGATVRSGLRKLAVYRAPDGTLHQHLAACPHLGCSVRWNGVENSWDCPCHGSRFDPYGKVLNGPASADLAPVGKEVESARE